MMKVKDVNYYGLNHRKVLEKYGKDLSYVGYICYDNKAMGVYFTPKPDRAKGHKDFLLFVELMDWESNQMRMYISGMDMVEFKKHVRHDALHCKKCDDVIYSLTGHHYHKCSCGNCSIDGGKQYLRYGFTGAKDSFRVGKYNVLTRKFITKK